MLNFLKYKMLHSTPLLLRNINILLVYYTLYYTAVVKEKIIMLAANLAFTSYV